MKAATVACALALAGLAGCSLGGDDEPKPAGREAREVAEVVRQLELALQREDWQAVCDDVFTSDARRRAGGADCRRLLRSDAAGLRRPRIELLGIVVTKNGARARVRTSARGQPPLTDVIVLRRERDGYRVESLRG